MRINGARKAKIQSRREEGREVSETCRQNSYLAFFGALRGLFEFQRRGLWGPLGQGDFRAGLRALPQARPVLIHRLTGRGVLDLLFEFCMNFAARPAPDVARPV